MSLRVDVGSELAGYRIERLLSRGGMGVVYLAEHLRLQRKVALKLLAPELSEDSAFRERFLRESQLAASLDHPNVIPIYDADEVDGQLYIAMRYVEGVDLRSLLDERERLEPTTALSFVAQLASALDAAHKRGLVHRDVKPGNVLVAGEHVYLSDFGLTKQASSQTGLTATGQLVGTVDYVAPEQIEGKPVDGRADVYSLGCLLYQCLAGRAPYARESEVATLWAHIRDQPPKLSDKRPELPKAIDPVVAKALAKDPDERYQTAGELATSARDALGVSSGELPQLRPPRRRNLRLLAPLGLAAAIAIGLGLFFALRGGGAGVRVALNSVAVIDPKTNKVVADVPVGKAPAAITFGDGSIWVANQDDATVSRIDPRTRKVTETIGVGVNGGTIAERGRVLWVADVRSPTVRRIDLDTGVGVTIRLPRVASLGYTIIAPVGSMAIGEGGLWFDQGDAGTVSRLALGGVKLESKISNLDVSSVAVGFGAVWVSGSSNVAHVDPTTKAVLATIPIGTSIGGSSRLAVGAGSVWAAVGDHVTRIDPRTDSAVGTTRLAADTVAVGAGGVWTAAFVGRTVTRLDSTSGAVVKTIRLPHIMSGLTTGGGLVWAVESTRAPAGAAGF